jgi:hypothetical protein
VKSILALVEATAEIRPPKQFDATVIPQVPDSVPRKIFVGAAVNDTPGVMSSPPIVNVPLDPRPDRTAKAGLVKFKPVGLGGKT